jgi:hypothetical protein
VHVKGASWKRGAGTILGDNDYAFIGEITGNGPAAIPAVFDIGNQFAVFIITLQRAYDSIGSGAGRVILANDGAVKIKSLDSNDEMAAILHLDRRGATQVNPVGLAAVGQQGGGTTHISLTPITVSAGVLQQDESHADPERHLFDHFLHCQPAHAAGSARHRGLVTGRNRHDNHLAAAPHGRRGRGF